MTRDVAIGAVRLGSRPAVVAAGGETDLAALVAAQAADLLELRADLFAAPRPDVVRAALQRLRQTGKPVLLTVRAAAEGGRAMPDDLRGELYRTGLPLADAIDVEIASQALAEELVPGARAAGCTIILSAHDMTATPSPDALRALAARARSLGADLPKLATYTSTPAELRGLLEVTLAERDGGIVTLGMGPLGPLSRVALPAAGSLLTYGAAGSGTAPGQLPVAELAALVARLFPS
jgi:3-dehydroquinate dehydratase-1